MSNLPVSLKRARNAERANRVDFTSAFGQLKATEQTFVMAYLENDDPRVAIRKALPSLQANVVNVRALDMMRRPLVMAAIAEKQNERIQRYEINAENILRETALVAFARMGDYVRREDDGTLSMDLSSIPEDELSERLAAVSEVTFEETEDSNGKTVRKTKFKLHSKLDGLEKLIKVAGLYAPERVDARVLVGGTGPNGEITVSMSVDDARKEWERYLDD